MITVLRLTLRSLRSRLLTSSLTIFSIALSVFLFVGVSSLRSGARAGFSGTISGVDLVVGARSGSLPLLLSSVFHIGSGSNDIQYSTYEHFRDHPAVAWTIPISLGDSHKGYRVVGTDDNFYQHYRYRRNQQLQFAAGHAPGGLFDCVLGSEVAERMHYGLGTKLILAHGLESVSLMTHADKPFTVTGILARTSTPVDQSIYITLLGVEAMHIDWTDGTPPALAEAIPASEIDPAKLKVDQISAFLVRTRSRINALALQREISTYTGEPLTAVIPAQALEELWGLVGYADTALSLVSVAVLIVGLLAMLATLYTVLNERRREVAVLRAIGLRAGQIFALFVLEALVITGLGTALGLVGTYALLAMLRSWIDAHFGLPLVLVRPSSEVLGYVVMVVGAGAVLGCIPAFRAYRNSLHDGLSAN